MQPIRLCLKNFCGHSETEFSFDDFSSALVIGRVKNNDRFSNGAGKSTIFNAIEYVIFNEIKFSSLEKTIRDGCDVCRVELDFLSSLDKSVYRIIRSNSRKTGTDVRLFKKQNDTWEDLTQRRVSDTEKEIVKIIGFNYKAFCASVLFSQAGSDNNVQRDFGNLPALTPEKRKSVLREVLQLNIYSNYEKLAKNKYGSVFSNLEKQKIILSTLGDPDSTLISLNKESELIDKQLADKREEFSLEEKSLSNLTSEYTILADRVSVVREKIHALSSRKTNHQEQISRLDKTIKDLKNKIENIPTEVKNTNSQIELAQEELVNLRKIDIDTSKSQRDLSNIVASTIDNRGRYNSILSKIADLKKPITDEQVCTNCRQVVSETHKHSWYERSKLDLVQLTKDKEKIEEEHKYLVLEKQTIEKTLSNSIEIERKIANKESTISFLTKEIEAKKSLYSNFSVLLEENISLMKENASSLEKISKELDEHLLQEKNNTSFNQLDELKIAILKIKKSQSSLSDEISKLNSKQAILKHQVNQCEEDKKNIVNIKKNIQDLERSLLLHSKVIQAFGSNGIPSLITHSILDELQEESNKWLLKLRPGLQLQFNVINDKNNKEQEDTLDILYFIDGNQREYKQLSGAQKIIVSLSIKLAILFIMNKRLGVDIKLMLLDEVDQALDEGGTEIFSDIIKIIQTELKVLVITHNDDLKHKFSHAIVVEQDENNVSKGKLINW